MDDNLWDTLKAIKAEDLAQGTLSPVTGGQKVTFQVKKDIFDQDNYVYIAVKAIDNVNLAGSISTISKLQTDVISPGKVTDLKTELLDDVQISFAAPGDDFGVGTGK